MTYRTAFGLAFDVEKNDTRKSGFCPAETDLGSGLYLFGELRLFGFAALLRLEQAEKLIVIGGNEGRYKGEVPTVNRAEAIREMLIHDHGIDPDRVEARASASNTGGNIAIMQQMSRDDPELDGMIVTSHYHLPRASLDIAAAGLLTPLFSAESFWLLEDRNRKQAIITMLGGGPLAERMTEEIQGIADKIQGSYKPRTDVKPS